MATKIELERRIENLVKKLDTREYNIDELNLKNSRLKEINDWLQQSFDKAIKFEWQYYWFREATIIANWWSNYAMRELDIRMWMVATAEQTERNKHNFR